MLNEFDCIWYFKFLEISIKEHEIHPVIKKENFISYYIREYMIEYYGKEVTTRLIPTGRVPGKLYGLIKVRKESYPARPVVSMINTQEYKLAKFLDYDQTIYPKFIYNSINI